MAVRSKVNYAASWPVPVGSAAKVQKRLRGHLFLFFWRETLVALEMASMRILEKHCTDSGEEVLQQRRTAW